MYSYAFYLGSVTSAFLVEKESSLLSNASKVSLFYNESYVTCTYIPLQHLAIPTRNCTSGNEGEQIHNLNGPLAIWKCKNSVWTLFM